MFIIPKWWGYYLISMPASLSGPQDHLQVLWFARRTHKTYSSDLLRPKEKAHGTKSEEARPRIPGSHTGCPQFLQHRIMTTRVKYCIPGKLVRDPVPSFYVAGHMGILYLACPRVPDLQRKSRYSSTKHTVFTNGIGTVRLSYLAMVGTLQKPKFSESSQRPILLGDLSKDRVSGWLC